MNALLDSILETRFLPFVEKPFRYIGNELNCVRKDLSQIALHGVLCFPEVYDIGMSHSGIQILYHIVNSRPSWALSRCFSPLKDAEAIMRRENIPLYSLEYLMPVTQADWLGFSVQYELQYTNIVNMLNITGLPIFSKDRSDTSPLVIAGGPCMNNPEPLADFIDAFVIGDGEETIVSVCTCLEECKRNGANKARKLELLSAIPGVYVPALYPVKQAGAFVCANTARAPVRAAKVSELSDANYPDKPLVPLIEVVHHRLAVEVMRGCTRGCRFCAAGYYYRPVRERSSSAVRGQMERCFETTGWRDVGLLSLSTSDYSQFPNLLRSAADLIKSRRLDVSIPSTRIDALTREQLDLLDAVSPASSCTLAPEAGSMRLRNVINKNFTDEAIFGAVDALMERNIQSLKLYFMIGLPTETAEDIDAIIELSGEIARRVWNRSRRRAVNISISPFSPKAQTPFQWAAMDSMESILEKSRRIKQALSRMSNIKVSYREPAMTYLETVMARGDRRLSGLIAEAWRSGARSDGWADQFNIGTWQEASKVSGVAMEPYVQAIALEQSLPWSAVTTGVSDAFLRKEYLRAMEGTATPDCRISGCTGCAVCHDTVRQVVKSEEPIAITETSSSAPAPQQQREALYCYRAVYSKTGMLRFLGHRDMMNVFHRAFTAALFPLAFSQGYHPHPRIGFGPPLPFGVLGEAEAFDAVTTQPVTWEQFSAVNAFLPHGLRIQGSTALGLSEDSLSSVIVAATYTIFPSFTLSEIEAQEAVKRVLESETLMASTVARGGGESSPERNIRPFILQAKSVSARGAIGVEALLSLSSKGTCRPSELVTALFPKDQFSDFTVSRLCCYKSRQGALVAIA